MQKFRYLIVGGGMAADAAAAGIREIDRDGTIGIVGAEFDPPYNRPPLSKGLWKGDPVDGIWRKTEQYQVDLHLRRRVLAIDRARKTITDGKTDYGYEKLLIATGGAPRRFPFGGDDIIYFRTLSDYQRLRELADSKERFTVVGGGFIGSEIAAALTMNGKRVTMLLRENAIGSHVYPAELAQYVTGYFREKGVDIVTGEGVAGASHEGETIIVTTASGRRIASDAVVAGIGVEPSVALARDAKLDIDNGILVDSSLRTTDPDVFAAGDVAAFESTALGKRIRVEHEDNALTQGKAAGRAMAGDDTPYDHLPFFYSDLFDLGYEAVGELNASLETFADWEEPNRKGVVYYLSHGRVRGVLLWGIFGKVDEARALIAEKGPIAAPTLKGRIRG